MKAVNLIPGDQRGDGPVGAGRSGGVAYAVLGLLAAIAILAFLYGKASRQISSQRDQVATLEAQAKSAQEQASALAPYTSFVALREQRAQAVANLVDSRFDWAHVFHEFGRVLNDQTSISSLSGTVGSGTATTTSTAATTAGAAASTPVTSATPPGSVPTFTLTGCATSQDAVAQMLQRLRLIDGVKEVTLQSSAASSSGSGGASGGCPAHAPTFSATVIFDPLPAASAAASATTAVSDSTGAAASAAAPTTTGVNAR